MKLPTLTLNEYFEKLEQQNKEPTEICWYLDDENGGYSFTTYNVAPIKGQIIYIKPVNAPILGYEGEYKKFDGNKRNNIYRTDKFKVKNVYNSMSLFLYNVPYRERKIEEKICKNRIEVTLVPIIDWCFIREKIGYNPAKRFIRKIFRKIFKG